jgi:hypothetical protein
VRTDRVRSAAKQVCEKWTLTALSSKFPVFKNKFPVLARKIPCSFFREFFGKGLICQASFVGASA